MKTLKAITSKAKVLEALAAFVVAEAKKYGATDSVVSIGTRDSFDISTRLGEVDELEGAQSRGLDLRVYVGFKSASTSTSDFRRSALRKLVKKTVLQAHSSEADPFAGLPEAEHLAKTIPDLKLFDSALATLTEKEQIELALAAEAEALKNPRIANSNGASFSKGLGISVLANSRGFLGSYVGSTCSLYASVVAAEPSEDPENAGEMQVGGWGHASRVFSDLESAESIGRKAAQKAVEQLGSRKVKSQVVPVVVDPQLAARLVSQFVGAANGSNVYRNSSFLAGKLGEVVAASGITIVDDPLMPGKIASRPYDGEGLPLVTRNIVEDGKLVTYLLNSYAARKLNTVPNSGSTGNVYVKAGTQTPEEIIASVENGLYLTSVSGPGYNQVTGDYSMGATGFWIEKGKLSFPVSEITVASNLLDMFKGIEAIGNDLEIRSSVSSPTLKIAAMTVAGE